MDRLYFTIRNFLIFVLITVIFEGALIFGSQTFLDKLILGLIVGFILTFANNVLKFLKLPVNIPSVFLINLVATFIIFIVLHSPFNYIRIEAKSVITGISLIDPITFTDATMGIVILSFTMAVLVSIFDFIHKKS